MKISGVVFAGLLAFGGFTGFAAADNGLVFSELQTAMCLADAEMSSEGRECIGQSAEACVNANELGRSTIGTAGCLAKEFEYWDARLNEAYRQAKQVTAQMDTDNQVAKYGMLSTVETLRDMQRAWIPYRDARCLFETSTWGNGTGASSGRAACLMMVTAEQTLLLLELAGGH